MRRMVLIVGAHVDMTVEHAAKVREILNEALPGVQVVIIPATSLMRFDYEEADDGAALYETP